jgi:two-component system chemotaxis sensor kinase CheA
VTEARDPLRFFRLEAREISEELVHGTLELERGTTPELVARLMRLAHTLKGAAAVVKQRAIADRTHALEDALASLRDGGPPSPDTIETILAHVDAIAAETAALGAPVAAAPAAPAVDEAPWSGMQLEMAEMEALARSLSEAAVQLRGLRESNLMLERSQDLARLVAESAEGPAEGPPGSSRLAQFAGDLHPLLAEFERRFSASVDQAERELHQAHAAAERLRLVRCGSVFGPLERAVRDGARALDKKAAFVLIGGDVRLEAQVLGIVHRALVQLVRNALAHGIEAPAERIAAGKEETGRIAIEVSRRSSFVSFLCRDDGAGIDLDAVRRAAAARGGEAPDDRDLLERLLEGGLSTATGVTAASGRGVGLDVVREAAILLNGRVTARTAKGEGTAIEIIAPVSLAAMQALIVEADGLAAAIPAGAVLRSVRIAPDGIARTKKGETILDDGKAIPFVPLTAILGAAQRANGTAGRPGPITAMVIDSRSRRAAIGVDRLRGAADIVVRPVPPLAHATSLVTGICLDPSGVPQLVLDPSALVEAAFAPRASGPISLPKRPAPILVIDDSLTTRVLEQSILEAEGYEVELAVSAEEALEKARTRPYALFLVDVEMPGMDGFEFVRTIRADPALAALPAILVTSRSAEADRRRGVDAGANGYVVKSEFDQGEVLAMIRRLLE